MGTVREEPSLEKSPLLPRRRERSVTFEAGADAEPETESSIVIRVPSRPVVVEPVLVLYVLAVYIMGQSAALFIYDKTLDGYLKQAGINRTILPGTSPGCGGNTSNVTDILNQVQTKASTFTGILQLITGLPAILVSLLLGPYSDKAGRRWGLIPPLIGGFIRSLLFVLVILMDWPVELLMIGAFMDGCGGFLTTLTMAIASYIADCTKDNPEKRIIRLTIVEVCSLVSVIVAPIGLGYWIQTGGYLYPFITVAGIFLVDLIYVIFFVPETIVPSKHKKVRFFTTDHFKLIGKMYQDVSHDKSRRWKLICLTVAFFISTLAALNFSVDILFLKNTPLCWDSVTIGYFISIFVGVSGVGSFINAKLMKRCLPDEIIAVVACIGALCLNIYKSLVINSIMMFCAAAFGTLSLLLIPTIRAVMSKLVRHKEQGRLFGAMAAAEMLALSVGAFATNFVYALTQQMSSGMVFLILAAVIVIDVILLGLVAMKRTRTQLMTDT